MLGATAVFFLTTSLLIVRFFIEMKFFTSVLIRRSPSFAKKGLIFVLLINLFFGFLRAQTAQVQLIHAAVGWPVPPVDVYVDGILWAEGLSFAKATSFISFPIAPKSSVVLREAKSVASSTPLVSFEVEALQVDKRYVFSVCDEESSAPVPVHLVIDDAVQWVSSDTGMTDVKFMNVGPKVPAFDVLLRDGGMILGGLGFGQISNYVPLHPVDNYLDVKASGTSNIFSTYRLSLQGYKTRTMRVFVVGDVSTARELKMYAVDDAGLVTPVDYAPVARVQYINAGSAAFDVYKNGTRFSNDALQGGAMPYKYLPADISFRIAISPAASVSALTPPPFHVFEYVFKNIETYLAVSVGNPGDARYPLDLLFYDKAREKATAADKVDLIFLNGSYSIGPLSLRLGGPENTTPPIAYSAFSDYMSLPAENVAVSVYDATTNQLLSTCTLDLGALRGQALVLFTTVDLDNPKSFDLRLAKPSGVTFPVCRVSGLRGLDASEAYLRCWPNPAAERLSVAFEAISTVSKLFCRVFDNGGRMVAVQSVAGGRGTVDIDLSPLGSGFYWLELCGENGQVLARQKFVKQTH